MTDLPTNSLKVLNSLTRLSDDPVAKGCGGFRRDLELRGYTVRYDQSKRYTGTLVERLVGKDPVRTVFTHMHRVQTRHNVEQFVYNLLCCRVGQQHLDHEVPGACLWVALPLTELRTPSRYRPDHISYRQIRRIVDCFRDHGMIEVVGGDHIRGKVTRIRPVGVFVEFLDEHVPDLTGNVTTTGYPEVLVLKGRNGLIEYDDDSLTHSLREQIRRYNDEVVTKTVSLHLPLDPPPEDNHPQSSPTPSFPTSFSSSPSHSVSSCPTTGNDPCNTVQNRRSAVVVTIDPLVKEVVNIDPSRISSSGPELRYQYPTDDGRTRPVPLLKDIRPRITEGGIRWDLDPNHLQARRIFNRGKWDRGGRWYAPFQSIPSALRGFLLIDGEPTIELDYGSLHIRLIYDGEGIGLHGDPYDIDLDVPRSTVKQMTNWMLNSSNHQSLYGLIRGEVERDTIDLNGHTPKEVVHAIRRRHPEVKQYFHSDLGIALMKSDSDLVRNIVDGDLCPLIIHDSFIVPASQEAELREVMTETYRRGLGVDPVVK